MLGLLLLVILIIVKDVEGIEAGFVLRHAYKYVLLLLLRLLRGIEESVEDGLERLDFINWASHRLDILLSFYFAPTVHLLADRKRT